jgi:putative Holliday junction resolvase
MVRRYCAIPATGRVLALDWGARRIGVAVSDETQLLATPLATLRRRRGKRPPLGAFLTLVEHEHPVGMVAGLPLDDSGAEGEHAREARELAETWSRRAGLPLDFLDESFTTADVRQRLIERGESPRHRQEDLDALAAARLLERWLELRRAG